MKTLEIFDSAICCSSGVCGVEVGPASDSIGRSAMPTGLARLSMTTIPLAPIAALGLRA